MLNVNLLWIFYLINFPCNLLLKMIFSVQNSNLMFSVGFSVDLVQIQARETVCGVFLALLNIPIQVWHMVKVMRRDFSEQHITQVLMTENQLGEMQMMEEVAEHVGMNYPETPYSRCVAQPFDDFVFPWEEGSMDNPITIEEDEGFSEPRTSVREPPRQPTVMEARTALRSIENMLNFQNSAARQLFDF